MTSEEFQALIPGYVSGQLTPAEQALFLAQLKKSPELQIEIEEYRLVWESLQELPQEEPSAAVRARFYNRLSEINSGRAPRSLTGGFAWWKPGLAGLVRQSAFVLALFCLGLYVGRVSMSMGSGRTSAPEVSQLRGEIQNLRQTVALSLMDRQSATSRLQGISYTSQVERPDSDLMEALVTALGHDPNTNVRLASLDALEKFSNDPNVRKALVASISLQSSPLVQIALIDALVTAHDQGATGEFRKLTQDSGANAAVRQRAEWGLQRLTF